MTTATTTTAAAEPRLVHVEHCMGTVFSIDVRDPGHWDAAVGEAVAWLHRVDAVFSTWRADSDISRIRRGELAVADADPRVGEVLDLCDRLQADTDGYFTARLDGRPDPTGLVKGWAVEQASLILRAHGSHNHAVNGGGDVQTAGGSAPGRPWRVGVTDPRDRSRVLAVAAGFDLAVATSGIGERGRHIQDPHTGRPADTLASVTVTGRHLTCVDAYATAAFAMGTRALRWAQALPGHEALAVTGTGVTLATSGFPRGTR